MVAPHFDWVIVGGGPLGVHVAVRLLADGCVTPDRLAVVDPAPCLLHRWSCCTASTGMRFLRSPAVHHLGVEPIEVLKLAGAKKRDRRRRGLFAEPYHRPALTLFSQHCDGVLERYRLAERHLRARVGRIDPGADLVRLELDSGTRLTAERVVLALGNSDRPLWPDAARALKDAGGNVQHVFGPAAPVQPDSLPDRVAIVGGGISAAQLAVRLDAAGKEVVVVARHMPREQQFDSDPGWIGPKHMQGFSETSDLHRRRALIQAARHRGSMPLDVLRDLRRSMRSGGVSWTQGAIVGGAVGADGTLQLELDPGRTLRVGAMVLATGFEPGRPGGTLVDDLISRHDLPVAPCGFPVVDWSLRWHPRVFVTGPLAELELGPTARNLIGGRRAADRIVHTVRSVPRRRPSLARWKPAVAVALAFATAGVSGCTAADSAGKPAAASDTSADSGRPDTGDSDTGAEVEPLEPFGNLLIEEVYYAGAVPAAGIDRYYSDQFIELVNVADAPVKVGGLVLGDAPGLAGAINPGNTPGGAYIADPDFVYLSTAWRIPGEPEDVLLAPGASLVIAHDAGEHNPYSPVDLSNADYETYVDLYGEDFDDAVVPNLESIWYNGGYDWLVTVFGPTILVLSIEADALEQVGGSSGPMKAPVSAVVDTMEALMDADSGDFKRLHDTVDSGFVHVSGTYTGESVRRRRDDRGALIDTNDSGADFEVSASPSPGGAR
jgi:hypothetical protein